MRLRSKLALIAAAALGVAALPAQAAVQITGYTYSPPSSSGGVALTSAGFSGYGSSGRFLSTIQDLVTMASHDQFTFCLDVLQGYYTYQAYNDVSLASVITNSGRQAVIAGLLTNADSVIDGATSTASKSLNAAAIGLAIWEASHETAGSPLDLNSGNFYAYGDFGAAAALANVFLGNVLNGTWTGFIGDIHVLSSATGQSQNQVYISKQSPVPEPSTWAMLLSGFGVIGAALRRRRQPVLARAVA